MFLFGEHDKASDEPQTTQSIKLLAWNLQSPSLERAHEQTNWLLNTNANVLLLTEAMPTEGSYYLLSTLESSGFELFYTISHDEKYFTAICVKGFQAEGMEIRTQLLPSRFQGVKLSTPHGEIQIVGIYAPTSWKNKPESYLKQRREFHEQVSKLLSAPKLNSKLIVGGDLNVLEPTHTPSVPGFEDPYFYTQFIDKGMLDIYREFHPKDNEYSWFSVERIGCRFDHFFITKDLLRFVSDCSYVHEARTRRLSDHSAMWLKFIAETGNNQLF